MKKLLTLESFWSISAQRTLALCLALVLIGTALPIARPRAQAAPPDPITKLSPSLQQVLDSDDLLVWSDPSRRTVRTLIQTIDPVSSGLLASVRSAGGSVVRQFSSIYGVLVELPKNNLLAIASRSDVERMSADHLAQQSASHLEVATGADQVRAYNSLLQTYNGLDGSGVGIAVLDSGIMASHSEFGNLGNLLGISRVTAKTDTVSSNTNLTQYLLRLGIVSGLLDLLGLDNKDGYGHGSHVAGTAAGRSIASGSARGFNGIAPNANLIDVRVLNGRGLGQTSDVIAGIDWVIANRALRNIKVINMSLGAASSESWVTDPLCRAVRRAVASGITVIVAAGNCGRAASGLEQYGSITAPGHDPTVITVGATNTHQTDARNDETITYFSSRGPTRGYYLDSARTRRYDNLLKPDLVAPGNRIVSAESNGAWLPGEYPQLHNSGTGARAFMQMSGSSVAAPVVAGAAALLLQKNSGLTPPLVKAILQYTAQQLPGSDICQQGAGLLNIEGATRLAGVLRKDISAATAQGTIRVGDSLLLARATIPAHVSTIAGQSVPWGGYGGHQRASNEQHRPHA
jgi:serine protease AprX